MRSPASAMTPPAKPASQVIPCAPKQVSRRSKRPRRFNAADASRSAAVVSATAESDIKSVRTSTNAIMIMPMITLVPTRQMVALRRTSVGSVATGRSRAALVVAAGGISARYAGLRSNSNRLTPVPLTRQTSQRKGPSSRRAMLQRHRPGTSGLLIHVACRWSRSPAARKAIAEKSSRRVG